MVTFSFFAMAALFVVVGALMVIWPKHVARWVDSTRRELFGDRLTEALPSLNTPVVGGIGLVVGGVALIVALVSGVIP